MTKHSYFPYTSTYSSTHHNTTNRKHTIHHKHTIYFNTPRLKHYLTMAATQQKFAQTPHQIYKKTCAMYIHLLSLCIYPQETKKILRTPPPHISSSEEILPRFTHGTLAQLRTNKSPFLKVYLHKVDAKTHPSPLCPLCNTHTHDTHHLFNCTHIRTTVSPLDLWTDPVGVSALLARWTEKLAGGLQARISDLPH